MDHEKDLKMARSGEGAVSDEHMRSTSEKDGALHTVDDDGAPDEILNGRLVELEVDLARVIGEDDVEGDWDADTSPFPAVRAVVPESDDVEMPVNTFRACKSCHPLTVESTIHAHD